MSFSALRLPARAPLPPDSPFIPPEQRVPAEPEAALRAVAVEPLEPPEAPLAAVEKLVRTVVAEVRKQEAERNRLNEIAIVVKRLTYGETIEFAEAICTANAGVELTQEALPAALHRWSVSRNG